jgi:hypothetical protein
VSVTLNEVALKALLEVEQGPVGRLVSGKAEEVVQAARDRVFEIFENTSIDPSQGVNRSRQADGSYIIGILNRGDVEEYLARKARFEAGAGTPGDWLLAPMTEVFPG